MLTRSRRLAAMLPPLARWLREPLVHFIAIAGGLFLFWHAFGDRISPRTNRIVISSGQLERARSIFQATHMRAPNTDELRDLVEQEIITQVYYREALALGLDQNDEVIERRLEQKLRLVTQDMGDEVTPTDADLQHFLDQHETDFATAPCISFSQIYLNPQLHSDLKSKAAQLLAQLGAADGRVDDIDNGDVLPIPHNFEKTTSREVASLFGAGFAEALATLPSGRWVGPIRSGFGVHLVLIRKRQETRFRPLAEVRDAVLREWRDAWAAQANDVAYRRMRARYQITIEVPQPIPHPRTSVSRRP